MEGTLGVALQSKMNEVAVIAVIKEYIKYLVMNKLAGDKDAVKAKIGGICSAALDRGIITQATIETIMSKLDKCELFYNTVECACQREEFLSKALCKGLLELDGATLTGEDAALISEAKEVFAKAKELRDRLVAQYKDLLLGLAQNFYNEYKNLFDPDFEKSICCLLGCCEAAPKVNIGTTEA